MEGLLVVDKPPSLSSFDVIRRIRRVVGIRQIGHTGTLDPLATGVLAVCLGWAVKLIQFLDDDFKRYETVVRLGVATETDDREGRVLSRSHVEVDEETVRQTLARFVGEISQLPPQYSAIKQNGKRAYAAARQGQKLELAPRTIRIDEIELLDQREDSLHLRVTCGKGTYIRSLCRDLGEALGCGAHMADLRRLQSGCATLEEALTLEEIEGCSEEVLSQHLISSLKMLPHLPLLLVDGADAEAIRHGRALLLDDEQARLRSGARVRIGLALDSSLLAIGEVREEEGTKLVRPIKVRSESHRVLPASSAPRAT